MSAGLLALLDDIATMTSLAGKKTAGIVGDDLALNAKGLVGIDPKREIPIVKKVAIGSLRNKAILVPAALLLSAVAPWAIMPLMMIGGGYLCYEGVEKIAHSIKHKNDIPDLNQIAPAPGSDVEKEKIKGAIKTDFILSAEIVVVALGAMAAAPLAAQALALSLIGVAMTVGVYGLVAGLVKLDDLGLHMMDKKGDDAISRAARGIGKGLVKGVPYLMKGISLLGTVAMFAVGGGILLHALPVLAHAAAASSFLAGTAITTATGLVAGFGLLKGVAAIRKVWNKITGKKPDGGAEGISPAAPGPGKASKLNQVKKPGVSFNNTPKNAPAQKPDKGPATKPGTDMKPKN